MSDETQEAKRAVEEARIAAVIDRAFWLPGETKNLSFRSIQAARNLVSTGLVVPAAEVERLRAELAQVTQWHDEVRQECAELRGGVGAIKAEALREVGELIEQYIARLPDFEGDDYPEGEYDGAWQALLILRDHADALSGSTGDIGDGTNEGDQG